MLGGDCQVSGGIARWPGGQVLGGDCQVRGGGCILKSSDRLFQERQLVARKEQNLIRTRLITKDEKTTMSLQRSDLRAQNQVVHLFKDMN